MSLGQEEVCHQLFHRNVAVGGFFDDFHYSVDIVESNYQTAHDMMTFSRFFEIELRAANDNFFLMFDIVAENFFQPHDFRFAVRQSQHNDAVTDLKLRLLKERVKYDLCGSVFFDFDNYTHTVSVALFFYVRNAFQFLFMNLRNDIFYQVGFVYLIRQLRNNNTTTGAVVVLFYLGLRADNNTASARAISEFYATHSHQNAPGGKIRSRKILHQVFQSDIGVMKLSKRCVDDFAEIVRRNIGSHADGDTVRTVYQNIRVT